MKSCVYLTDPNWLEALQKHGVINGVNFWRKDSRSLDLLPGDPFYFKVRGSMIVAGRGFFREQIQLTIKEAWSRFGLGNGTESESELLDRAVSTLRLAGPNINCLILDHLEILPVAARPELTLEEFPRGIMNCKFFENGTLGRVESAFPRIGAEQALSGLQSGVDQKIAEFDPAFISTARSEVLRSVCLRRGQSQFRQSLLIAYNDSCCVTGERAVAVLEAAHIHPYVGTDTNHPTNGLLLRSDWHTLFDLGLWTIDGEYRVLVSSELAGTTYEHMNGQAITVPRKRHQHPSLAAIKYHREKIFRG